MNWNKSDIERLHASGKIMGYFEYKHEGKLKNCKSSLKKPAKNHNRSKAKDWIEWNLMFWANEYALEMKHEYKFHAERGWRFDWAIPAIMVAVEFEGGIFLAKSGHNTAKHYTKDAQKYNAAQAAGWTVLRYTAKNFQEMPGDLAMIVAKKLQKVNDKQI